MEPRRASDGRRGDGGKVCTVLIIALCLLLSLCACQKESASPPSSPSPPSPPRLGPVTSPASPTAAPAEKSSPPAATTAYTYEPRGRPDPFQPLITPEMEGKGGKKGREGLAVSDLKLTGIIWDKKEYVALVEAPDGLGYVLKVNDRIGASSRVARISSDSVIFEVKEKPYLPGSRVREVVLTLKKEE